MQEKLVYLSETMLACWFDVLIFAIFIEPYLVYMAYGESGLDNDFDRKDLWYYGGNATKEDEDDWIRLDVTEFTVRLFPLLSKVMVERNLDRSALNSSPAFRFPTGKCRNFNFRTL